jgi:flagellar hook-associated protein 2
MVQATSNNTSVKLDSFYTNLINTTLTYERQQKLDKLTAQRDALDVKKSIYTDLQGNIAALSSSVKSLWSTQGSYALTGVTRNASVTSNQSGSTVLSATATSTAKAGSYSISDISLSSTHRIASAQQSTSESALGIDGTSTINGVDFTISSSDTLYSIASKINSATYETGKGVKASVVDRRLVLESQNSGKDYKLSVSGTGLQSLGFIDESGALQNQLSDGLDASFKVNGMTVTRSSHTGLTDVITGVTLNFASDAKGNGATLNIADDVGTMKNSITDFLKKFNSLQNYLGQKLSSTKVDDTHYTRGSLADDSGIRYLKAQLADQMSLGTSFGSIRNLNEIGITFDKDNQLSVTDSTKLEAALKNNLDDVKSFFDTKMSGADTLLNQYTGTQGILNYTMTNFTDQKSDLDKRITTENSRLESHQQSLTQQYLQIQDQLTQMQYTLQLMNSMMTTTTS